MSAPRRKIWGWGFEGEGLGDAESRALAGSLAERYGVDELKPAVATPVVGDVELPPSRLEPPAAVADRFTDEPYERLLHAYGKSYPDAVRAFRGEFPHPPDLVAYPRSDAEVLAILDWASDAGAAVVPFGGGSSVCGGVEPAVCAGYAGTVSLDLAKLDRVLEIDRVSRAARIQAGIRGPALEAALRPHALTLRHFPQSFEHSTLGGWIATRSGGHYASLYTHIDDFVESLRVITPAGPFESRRLPGSGAGPSPDRLMLGSEGTLGVVTEAWMRLQDRPSHRASAAVRFADFLTGAGAVRALSQSGLFPTNCRLIDASEAANTGAGDGVTSLLVLGFESADHPVDAWMARALELIADHGGVVHRPEGESGHREGAAGAWRDAFLRAPYFREVMVPLGVIADTFETAIPWNRFEELHRGVTERMGAVLREVTGRPGSVTCRFTHVYPDGPAPYFTFQGLGSWSGLLDQWREIKAAANEMVIDLGGTITHHHAVGRDHRPGWERQRPTLFADVLRAAKQTLDPAGVLNPGVLFDPAGRDVGVTGAMADA